MDRKFVSVKNIFWLIPAALIGWYFYTRSKFTFNLVGIKLKPKPAVIMQVYNPTSESSKIDSIVADVYYKGTRLGIINQFNPVTITANTRTNVDLPLQADGFGFAYLLADFAKQGTAVAKNAVIDIKGTINVGGLPVSFTQTFNLS